MTTSAIDRITSAAPAAPFVGQATAIEQSRAVAEVHAAVVVAQQRPRDVQAALKEMREVCQLKSLSERAFYSYPKAGSTVSGPSIHLARELARIWGNIQYNVAELSRDNAKRESEMQAVAWDLQTNTRSATTFVAPHKRDTKQGQKDLTDLRDVYESNSNQGARRARAMIFAVLPAWFVDEAIDICNQTLKNGGGKPMAHRIADIIKWYAEAHDISETQLAENRGKPTDKWTEHDIAQLGILGKSINRGEISLEEAFPSAVTAEELLGTKPAKRVVKDVSAAEVVGDTHQEAVTTAQDLLGAEAVK